MRGKSPHENIITFLPYLRCSFQVQLFLSPSFDFHIYDSILGLPYLGFPYLRFCTIVDVIEKQLVEHLKKKKAFLTSCVFCVNVQ